MRLPLLALLFASLLAFAACGEEESGIGAGQEQAAERQKEQTSTEQARSAEGGGDPTFSQEAIDRSKPKVEITGGQAPTELGIKDLTKGSGVTLKSGDFVAVNYVGALFKDGKEFDNSFDKQPLQFQLGTGGVVKGFDQGLVGAKVGARRELVIPANLAYGDRGSPPKIGPNEPLVFVIDVLATQ